MIENMRIGGQVRCDPCLPRVTAADCRDHGCLEGGGGIAGWNRQIQRASAKNVA